MIGQREIRMGELGEMNAEKNIAQEGEGPFKRLLFRSCVLLTLVFGHGCLKTQDLPVTPPPVQNMSDFYGFSGAEKRSAFESLCQKAGLLPAGKGFGTATSHEQFITDLVTFVSQTQEKFVVRTGRQERWDVGPLQWMSQAPEAIKANLKILGFLDAVLPQESQPDAVCVLGSTRPTMENRMAYLVKLMEEGHLRSSHLVLLAGERYVTPGVDGTVQELGALARKCGKKKWQQLTETDLLKEIYQRSPLAKQPHLQVHVIHTLQSVTPDGTALRPTTQSTTVDFSEWQKKNPAIERVVFVSSQPHVAYQEAVIRTVLRAEKSPLKVEVIGQAFGAKTQGQNIGFLVGALGSYLWAVTPLLLANQSVASPLSREEKQGFRTLYAKQPLVYMVLPPAFRD